MAEQIIITLTDESTHIDYQGMTIRRVVNTLINAASVMAEHLTVDDLLSEELQEVGYLKIIQMLRD